MGIVLLQIQLHKQFKFLFSRCKI